MDARIRTFAQSAALASPIFLALAATLWMPSPTAVIEPAKPPAELLDIAALDPKPVIVTVSASPWRKEQNDTPPTIELTLDVAQPIAVLPELDQPSLTILSDEANPTALDPGVEARLLMNDTPIPVADFMTSTDHAGTLVKTTWAAGEALHGASIATPVLVATGTRPGPTLCITAAVHGDELNGIETVRRLLHSVDPSKLAGRVIGVPIVNLHGFHRQSRYLADRRDLNRFFPGNPTGSSASRMAHSFFNEVIKNCDALVDLHTGSFHRTNIPQLRADLNNPDVLTLTKGFGSTVILHSPGGVGTLRRAAADAGIPAVTLEAGEPLRLQTPAVDHSVKALFTLLDTMEIYNKRSFWGTPEPTYYSSAWVRADHGGILLASVKLGRKVKEGDHLGTVTDPITNERSPIVAPYAGRIIGMALNQFVMPGFATFHLAREADPSAISEDDHETTSGLNVALMQTLGPDESE
jgi:predicted deacylase